MCVCVCECECECECECVCFFFWSGIGIGIGGTFCCATFLPFSPLVPYNCRIKKREVGGGGEGGEGLIKEAKSFF